ncbi:extracellular tyrosine-protein kinase PKDCC-like [Dendronephthya gigantea]|uniref:extracellular tyrosine-protein kinase PKDCC-like n=1 Tax=Dendronephthya gigantea TaxID=151771 RepID=UPI0010698EAE|nr:extracellular tyrosine-protein kinase PKDCC-like [Dendronephthya gigantea]
MSTRSCCRYGRLTERLLWIACCVACSVCLICVFLSLYYLEDHHDILACQGGTKAGDTVNYRTLFKSYEVENLSDRDSTNFQEVIAENIALKRTVNRLASEGFRVLSDRSGRLPRYEERVRYIQDIQNEQLGRTIRELRKRGPFKDMPTKYSGIAETWQERSLKFIIGESPRFGQENLRQDTNEISRVQETLGSYRDNGLGCQEISQIIVKEELGRGYTKLTQRGVYNGLDVAVKSVGLDSTDINTCVQEKRAKLRSDCLLFSRYKVMKELLLYQQLSHPNVIKLLGYCFQNDQDSADIQNRGLTVVTELGTPLNLMTVLQMAWPQRFRIAVGLARLIKYLSSSPLGSLVIRDFQLIQFVTINGDLRFSDLDDIGNEGHSCRSKRDCVIGDLTHNITLPCVKNFCQGYNEKWNLYNLQRFYFKMFLLPGSPQHVLGDLENIEKQAAMLNYNSEDLARDLERVLGRLRSGQGSETEKYRPHYRYKAIPRADFPGRHDYECDHSISLVNCQSLKFDEIEAMKQCDEDIECKAFVMSYDKTWIGYKWVFFKNNSTDMVFSAKNMIYIKVT